MRARAAAAIALGGYVALAVELLLVVVLLGDPLPAFVALVAVGVGVPLTWVGSTRPRWRAPWRRAVPSRIPTCAPP